MLEAIYQREPAKDFFLFLDRPFVDLLDRDILAIAATHASLILAGCVSLAAHAHICDTRFFYFVRKKKVALGGRGVKDSFDVDMIVVIERYVFTQPGESGLCHSSEPNL